MKAPNIVIVEISKGYLEIETRLLGAHRWKEILKKPDPTRLEDESRIYFSSFGEDRKAQKSGELTLDSLLSFLIGFSFAGWRRIDVHDSWFNGWHPVNRCAIMAFVHLRRP